MLFPPTLMNTQPVVDVSSKSIKIYYTLSTVTSANEFDSFQVIISNQSDNKAIYNEIINSTNNPIEINNLNNWVAGYLYKVQIRLVKDSTYSEWSNVMIIKPISAPSLGVKVNDTELSESEATNIYSLSPTFYGLCNIDIENKEIESRFRFTLTQGESQIAQSDWLEHRVGTEDIWNARIVLTNHQTYNIKYEIETNNGYSTNISNCSFTAVASTLGDAPPVTLSLNSDKENAKIDVVLQSNDPEVTQLTGNFVIVRASEKDNFTIFEDIKFLNFGYQPIVNSFVAFQDYSIESGITYQYGIQEIKASRRRSNMRVGSQRVKIDFEYCYLLRDDIQLKLALNQKISNFKHSVLRSKQDTLGDQYPHISQNGNAYYAEFPISGLITYQENAGTFFDLRSNDGVYYKDEKVLGLDRFEERTSKDFVQVYGQTSWNDVVDTSFDHNQDYAFGSASTGIDNYAYANDAVATSDRRNQGSLPSKTKKVMTQPVNNEIDFSISSDLTNDNIFIEKKFREKVEEFLNEFNYKLYKSPTEGNIVVALMNVSLSPIVSLGRMLYEFSATAYEVLDNDLQELNTYGVIDIGEEIEIGEIVQSSKSFGQVYLQPEDFPSSTPSYLNVIDKIKEQQHISINETLEYQFEYLDKVWIEAASREITSKFIKIQSPKGKENILIPADKIYTVTFSNEKTFHRWLSIRKVYFPIVINYVCTNKIHQKQSINIVETESQELKFDQCVWNVGDDNNLLNFIKRRVLNNINPEVQDGDFWEVADKEDANKKYRYRFDYLSSFDIETQLGSIISIGESENNYTNFKIGMPSDEEGIIGTTINSNRIFFPILLDDLQIYHANYLYIDKDKDPPIARQAIINFTYYLTIQTVTTISTDEATGG